MTKASGSSSKVDAVSWQVADIVASIPAKPRP
jgi:hypothetical protein